MANLQASIGKSGWPIRSGPRTSSDGRGGGRGRGASRRKWGDNGFDQWGGYMSAKKAKLADQFNAAKEGAKDNQTEKGIFNGVSIFVNGWTDPSADELKRLMMVHDGNYHHYYSVTRTTHIIATNLPYAKIKELKGERVVRPSWITESVAAGKLLDWQNYQLYRDIGQKNKLNFAKVTKGSSALYSSDVKKEVTKVGVKQELRSLVEDDDEIVLPSDEERVEEHDCRDGFSDGDDDLFAGMEDKFANENSQQDVKDNPSPPVENGTTARVQTEVVKAEPVSFSSIVKEIPALNGQPSVSGGAAKTSAEPKGNVDPWGIDFQFDDDDDFNNLDFDGIEAQLTKKADDDCKARYDEPLPASESANVAQVPSDMDEKPAMKTEKSTETPVPIRKTEKVVPKKDDDGRRIPKPILSEFYGRSRLHHISTMGTFFKDYVAELHATGDKSFPGLEEFLRSLPSTSAGRPKPVADGSKRRVIMHIDMDCFFVSVGLRKHPELLGKPVAVTHSRATGGVRPRGQNIEFEAELRDQRREARDAKRKGRVDGGRYESDEESDGEEAEAPALRRPLLDNRSSTSEVSSCSYEARAKGVRNGMYLGEAVKRCPDLVPIAYDFEGYTEVSKMLYDTIARYTHAIEAVSCDEMFVDLTDVLRVTGASPLEFASHLRKELCEKTQCNASAGLGPNMLLARLATKVAKPNGQKYVSSSEACEFMLEQTVRDLPGVGGSTTHRVEEKFRASTCGDLQQIPLSALKAEFGPKTGEKLYNFCRGLDDRLLTTVQSRKSVSAAMNYAIRFTTHKEAQDFIRDLSVELAGRMERLAVKCSNLTLKLEVRAAGAPVEPVKFMGTGVCDSLSRQTHLFQPTRDPEVIAREALKLYSALNVVPLDLRGLGLQATKLEGAAANIQSRVGLENANQPKMSDFLKTKQPTAPSVPPKKAPEPDARRNLVPDILTSPIRPRPTAVSSTPSPKTSNFMPSPRAAALYEKLMNPLSPARTRASPKNSPRRNNIQKSPKRGVGARRGRPRALVAGDNRQKDIRSAFGGKKPSGLASSVVSVVPESAPRRPANINGLRETEEVKVLLKQWVEHCGDDPPNQEDVERFASFLADLCREHDLVAVDALLKYFRRLLCDSRGSRAMKETYLDLALCVSQETVVTHGAPLFYRTDFD